LRKAKEDERLPERKVERPRTEGESAFQGVGPIGQRIETDPKLFCYMELRCEVYLRKELDG